MKIQQPVGPIAALVLLALASTADAQSWPAKPIRIISPYPPAGANDLLARIIAPKLSEQLGQPVVVENRAGATGNIGAELVAKAPADGYTLLMGQAGNLTINISLMAKIPFDPVRDFSPVTMVASTPNVLVVHPSLPVRTVKDLIALAKAKPGQINYATSGIGSPGHLAAELLNKSAGIRLVHIPYKGAAPALLDVVAGNAHLYFTSAVSAQPFIPSGRLRMVAVASAKRSPSLPEVPTVAEAGFPEFDVSSWWGVVAPASTPREVVMRLQTEIHRVIALPEIRAKLAEQGLDIATNTPEQFAAYIKSETAKWAKLIREVGVKPE
ncbi:MAG: tripartite tricarboxylate transporter substrate binding protein [Betaproteobacteria bacterium]